MANQPRGALPSTEEGLRLWERLRDGDPVAFPDLAIAYLDHLVASLEVAYPRVDEHLRVQAAEDALIALAKTPSSYDPRRSSLNTYLGLSSRGDLLNALDREKRHLTRRVPLETVELSPRDRNYLQDDEADPARIIEHREEIASLATVRRVPDEVYLGLSASERAAVALVLDGERRTSEFIQVLGLGRLPSSEQEREVKRVKDRLKKRLQRAGGRT